jgi:hypothetical protein
MLIQTITAFAIIMKAEVQEPFVEEEQEILITTPRVRDVDKDKEAGAAGRARVVAEILLMQIKMAFAIIMK